MNDVCLLIRDALEDPDSDFNSFIQSTEVLVTDGPFIETKEYLAGLTEEREEDAIES